MNNFIKLLFVVVLLVTALPVSQFQMAEARTQGFFNLMLAQRNAFTTFTSTVVAENDDGEAYLPYQMIIFDGENGAAANDLWMGSWDDVPAYGFIRFTLSQAIPAGATVTNASIQLYGIGQTGDWNGSGGYLKIAVEDSGDAPQVTTYENAPGGSQARTLSSSVRWPTAGNLTWNTAGLNTSLDISSIIQFLVNKYGGLASGAHVQFWIYSDQLSVQREVTWAGLNHPSFSTQLNITYQ